MCTCGMMYYRQLAGVDSLLHCVGPGVGTQVVSLNGRSLYLLSHLVSLTDNTFLKNKTKPKSQTRYSCLPVCLSLI